MTSKRSIAIIGAGKTGREIVRGLSGENCRLIMMDRNPVKVQDLLRDLSCEGLAAELLTSDCAREACWEADMIILATPLEAEKEVAEKIRQVAVGKVVLSISGRNGDELQKLLPHSKVEIVSGSCWSGSMTSRIFPAIPG